MDSAIPDRAIRVGVTGARRLDPANRPLIEGGVSIALAAIREQVTEEGEAGAPLLRFISPLAEGADRLVAQMAIAQGYRLETIFPFAVDEYRRDFFSPVTPGVSASECLAEFDRLMSQATSVLELDGRREAESASYEAVGRAVVRNSDVLIAVWNGAPGAGRGGTADTVRFALDLGVPVWWVRADGGDSAWLTEPAGIAAACHNTSTMQALAELKQYLALLFRGEAVPLAPETRRAVSLFSRRVTNARARSSTEVPKQRLWFSAYGRFERLLTRGVASDPYPVYERPDSSCWQYWQALYQKENNLSNIYMSAYRSAFLIIFVMAAFVLSMEGLSIAWPDLQAIFKFVEIVVMGFVVLIVVSGKRQGWHTRAISHRLTAELIRKQSYLALLGGSLSISPEISGTQDFLRYLRASPRPTGCFDAAFTARNLKMIEQGLLHEQEVYHRNRHRKMVIAGKRLAKIATFLFAGGFVVAISQFLSMIFFKENVVETSFALVASALPAFAAFAMGIKSYAELEIVADQSSRMEVFMRTARRKLQGFDCDAATASQSLGEIVQSISLKMLEDLQGWSTVSRSKALEAG